MKIGGSLWMGGIFGAFFWPALFCFSRGNVVGIVFLAFALIPLSIYICFGTIFRPFQGKIYKGMSPEEKAIDDRERAKQALKNVGCFAGGIFLAFLVTEPVLSLVIDQS